MSIITQTDLLRLWNHIYGNQRGYLGLFAGHRNGGRDLKNPEQTFLAWPDVAGFAEGWIKQQAAKGNETYFCAHLLTGQRRIKEHAAPIHALYVDGDGAKVPSDWPQPTAIVESSPGKEHYYWRLSTPIDPARAEDLNRRIAYALGADPSGWDLGQLLRPPGLPNFKYVGAPTVRLIHLDNDTAYDANILDRILPDAPRRSSQATHTETEDDDAGDEPPVRLSDYGRQVYNGERPILKDDGTVDRSDTLWAIAKELAHAGATRTTIAGALKERDETLGYHKYSGRRDGGAAMYAQAAARAVAEAIQEQAFRESIDEQSKQRVYVSDDEAVLGMRAEIDQLKAENDELRTEIQRMRADRSLIFDVFRNKEIRGEKLTGMVVAFEIASAESRAVDKDGWVRVPRARIAEKTGVSEQSVSQHISRLDEWGLIEKKTVRAAGRIDPDTGEIFDDPRSELHVKLLASPQDTLRRLATIAPFNPKKWGGKRIRCTQHPDADLILRKTYECTVCHEIIHSPEPQRISPEGLPEDDPDEETQSSSFDTAEGEGSSVVRTMGDDFDTTRAESGQSSSRVKMTFQRGNHVCIDCGTPCGDSLRCSPCAAAAVISKNPRAS